MAKKEIDEVTEKTLSKGGLLVRMYFDMHGETPDELQPIMTDLINNKLLKAPGVVYCFGGIDEPVKSGDLYSTSAIVTTLLSNLESLVGVVFSFAPVGIEVIKPDGQYVMRKNDIQSLMLALSDISISYSNYILQKTLSPEDYAKVQVDMTLRKEMGKKLIEKKGAEQEQ